MLVKLKIFRFDPEKDEIPTYQTYHVEADPMDRLLDCLIESVGTRFNVVLSDVLWPWSLWVRWNEDQWDLWSGLPKTGQSFKEEFLSNPPCV